MPDGIRALTVKIAGVAKQHVRKQVKVACRPEDCRITIRRRSPGMATIFIVWSRRQATQDNRTAAIQLKDRQNEK